MKTVMMAAIAGLILLGATGTTEPDNRSECIICWAAPNVSTAGL